MTARKLQLLEKAFNAEIESALLGHRFHFMQTKSKLADALVDEGYLNKVEQRDGLWLFQGYCLTELGRFTYCSYCSSTTELRKAQ